jgi:hypothetical protein
MNVIGQGMRVMTRKEPVSMTTETRANPRSNKREFWLPDCVAVGGWMVEVEELAVRRGSVSAGATGGCARPDFLLTNLIITEM